MNEIVVALKVLDKAKCDLRKLVVASERGDCRLTESTIKSAFGLLVLVIGGLEKSEEHRYKVQFTDDLRKRNASTD